MGVRCRGVARYLSEDSFTCDAAIANRSVIVYSLHVVNFLRAVQQDTTKEYLNQRGVPESEFAGSKKRGGVKGEVKRGEVVGE